MKMICSHAYDSNGKIVLQFDSIFPSVWAMNIAIARKKKMCVLSFALISVLLLHSMANWYTFDKGFARTFQRSSIYISSTQCVCLSNRHRFGNATFYLMQFMRTKQKNWASLLFHICLCSSSSWQNIPLLEFGGLCSSFVNQIWWLLIYSRWSSAIYFFVVIHFFFYHCKTVTNSAESGRKKHNKPCVVCRKSRSRALIFARLHPQYFNAPPWIMMRNSNGCLSNLIRNKHFVFAKIYIYCFIIYFTVSVWMISEFGYNICSFAIDLIFCFIKSRCCRYWFTDDADLLELNIITCIGLHFWASVVCLFSRCPLTLLLIGWAGAIVFTHTHTNTRIWNCFCRQVETFRMSQRNCEIHIKCIHLSTHRVSMTAQMPSQK